MSGFTRGPWEHDAATRSGFIVCAKNDWAFVVNSADDEGRYGAIEKEADARLIAAAPELLEALRKAFEYLDAIPESAAGGDDDAVRIARIARAALDLAEGK